MGRYNGSQKFFLFFMCCVPPLQYKVCSAHISTLGVSIMIVINAYKFYILSPTCFPWTIIRLVLNLSTVSVSLKLHFSDVIFPVFENIVLHYTEHLAVSSCLFKI